MFTGIIDHCGIIESFIKNSLKATLTIRCNFKDLQIGESIAVDGICLTVIDPKPGFFSCELSPETLRLVANNFNLNQKVNLERALRVGDRLGGHWVSGHVDQKAVIKNIISHDDCTEIEITNLSKSAMAYIFKKGSITVNGVSLTINEAEPATIKLMLIPHTLERTNLSDLKRGSEVNLEFDWLAKIVSNQLKQLEIPVK